MAQPRKTINRDKPAGRITARHVKLVGLSALAAAALSAAVAIVKGTIVCTGPIKTLSCMLAATL